MVIDSKKCQDKHRFTYSKKLIFNDPKLEQEIKRAIKQEDFIPNSYELGLSYKTQIATGHMPEVEVRYISTEVGYGLFTTKEFEKGEYIGEYTGLIMADSSYLKIYNYLFKYPVQNNLGKYFSIDAEPFGNHTRFINHSFSPNLSKHYAYLNELYHMIFICQKKIAKGEQLTFDYGKNYWYLRGLPENF